MLEKYQKLITSQYKNSVNFQRTVATTISPVIDVINCLTQLNQQYEIDTAIGNQLTTLAYWTGTPTMIPGAIQLGFFGFQDQENSLTFGELSDKSIGGYFRELGQSGTGGLTPEGDFLRRLVKAKILRNKSSGQLDDTKQILALVLDHQLFTVTDNYDMTVTFKFNANYTSTQKVLVQMFFPLPVGVALVFGD